MTDHVDTQNSNQIETGEALTSIGNVVLEQQHYESRDPSQERLNRYQEQRGKVEPDFKYIQKKREDGTINLCVEGSATLTADLHNATLHAATGSTNIDYVNRAMSKATASLFVNEREADSVASSANALVGALLEMAPKDITDGILCRRIITLDMHIAEYLARASNSDQSSEAVDRWVNSAAKLSRILNETIETRTRYLRQGEQKVTVTHQYVNVQGGQAIISGNINQGGGVYDKK